MQRIILTVVFALAAATEAASQDRVPGAEVARQWQQVVAAEDARAQSPAQLRTIMQGTRSRDLALRTISIRAIGRLQRPALADSVIGLVKDTDPMVRAEAALAVARAFTGVTPPERIRRTLLDAYAKEADAHVIGAYAEAVGQLRHPDVAATRVTAARLVAPRDSYTVTFHPGWRVNDHELGIARGLNLLARQPAALRAGLDTARAALIELATSVRTRDRASAVRVRTVAAQTIALAGLGDTAVARILLSDTEPMVRREGVAVAGSLRDTAAVRRLNAVALEDSFWMVRHDAVRQYAARVLRTGPCSKLLPFAEDPRADAEIPAMHVRLTAIELMGGTCTADAKTVTYLDSVAGALPDAGVHEWHAPARAMVALAAKHPRAAANLLRSFAVHQNPFVRTYGATAAGMLKDIGALYAFARDRSPNVRTTAVQALRRVVGHSGDKTYLAQLAFNDSQLLMAATAALDSTRSTAAIGAALDALDRVTALESETSRDGRAALLKLIGSLAKPANDSLAGRLTPYLRDFDVAIADSAAAILTAWTGREASARPRPLAATMEQPTYQEAVRIGRSKYVLQMETGDSLVVELFPFDAPMNAARFAKQAADGWFNGITMHRVEPSFVVQGGSPNANEYAGAPLFSRDELGRPNWRGTIGLSTRGHDTGDAQIFINSIDNVRLDPLYTVFGQLTDRTSAADMILEGAVIRRVRVRL